MDVTNNKATNNKNCDRQKHQQLIDQRLVAANQKRFSDDYIIGEEILKLYFQPDKLEPRATGPFVIEQVHANGIVTIRIAPNVIERISLRRIKPAQYYHFHNFEESKIKLIIFRNGITSHVFTFDNFLRRYCILIRAKLKFNSIFHIIQLL